MNAREALCSEKRSCSVKTLLNESGLFPKRRTVTSPAALRYALRIGLLAIENPELTAEEIKDILEARAELDAGMVEELDIENL